MRRTANLLIVFLLAACSPDRSDNPQETDKSNVEVSEIKSSATTRDPALDPYPQTKPDGSPLDEVYCSRVGNQPVSPFENSKVCFMIACKRGDAASCKMAQTYNGNLVQDDEPEKPLRLEDMDYFSARKIILGYGWKPLGGPCQGGGMSDAKCKEFPEIGNCQGTGIAYCDMNFARKSRCLVVVTTGGPPDSNGPNDTHVDWVKFHAGPCSKDPNQGQRT